MYLDKTIAKPPFSQKGGLNMCLLGKHGFSEKPIGNMTYGPLTTVRCID